MKINKEIKQKSTKVDNIKKTKKDIKSKTMDKKIKKEKVEVQDVSEPVKTKQRLVINKIKFNNFVEEETKKSQIILHHTNSGDGIRGDIESFANNTDGFSTHFIIERNGTIHQLVDTKYWCNHLKVNAKTFYDRGFTDSGERNKLLSMSSISIHLDNWGELEKLSDKRYRTYNGRGINLETTQVSEYYPNFRKHTYYENYTSEQLESLGKLLIKLTKENNIDTTYKGIDMFELNQNAMSGENGIWSHVSFKEHISNCHPDDNLILLLNNLKSGN